jgi:ABC-type lipoprotein export system ATPase subunit
LLFIDLEKAYDNIPLIQLWKALEETVISSTLTKTVKELDRRSLSYIKQVGLLSGGFEQRAFARDAVYHQTYLKSIWKKL